MFSHLKQKETSASVYGEITSITQGGASVCSASGWSSKADKQLVTSVSIVVSVFHMHSTQATFSSSSDMEMRLFPGRLAWSIEVVLLLAAQQTSLLGVGLLQYHI